MRPQTRQWWRRRSSENRTLQCRHAAALCGATPPERAACAAKAGAYVGYDRAQSLNTGAQPGEPGAADGLLPDGVADAVEGAVVARQGA